jgi:hypothetical protein
MSQTKAAQNLMILGGVGLFGFWCLNQTIFTGSSFLIRLNFKTFYFSSTRSFGIEIQPIIRSFWYCLPWGLEFQVALFRTSDNLQHSNQTNYDKIIDSKPRSPFPSPPPHTP